MILRKLYPRSIGVEGRGGVAPDESHFSGPSGRAFREVNTRNRAPSGGEKKIRIFSWNFRRRVRRYCARPPILSGTEIEGEPEQLRPRDGFVLARVKHAPRETL